MIMMSLVLTAMTLVKNNGNSDVDDDYDNSNSDFYDDYNADEDDDSGVDDDDFCVLRMITTLTFV